MLDRRDRARACEPLSAAQALPGLEGEHELERLLHVGRRGEELGQPQTQPGAQLADQMVLPTADERRAPAVQVGGALVGRDPIEEAGALAYEGADPLGKARARIRIVQER